LKLERAMKLKMAMRYLRGICALLTLVVASNAVPHLYASSRTGASKAASARSVDPVREEAQKALFAFVSKFYNWAGYFYLLRKDESQDVRDTYFLIKSDKAEKFSQLLNDNRKVLLDLNRFNDLNMVENVEIIPFPIYEFLRQKFAISSMKEPIDDKMALLQLIGGSFKFADGSSPSVAGFFDEVTKYPLSTWQPVKKFINNFESTVNRDLRLARLVGRSLLPLVRHYFNYLDLITRLRILNEVVDEALSLGIDGEDTGSDVDKITIKVFQSTGPVMMKLLQQLQDETKGETDMTRVLKGIEQCKAMPEKVTFNLAKDELVSMTGNRDVSDKRFGFKFRTEPLGIASIAQTHLFKYRDQDYVVKIQKNKVADVFAREAKALKRLVTSEEEFDKGMKQRIANIHAGIIEELDFNFERRNIEHGYLAYNDPINNIVTIENPSDLRRYTGKGAPKGSQQVLIMTKAEGAPLNKVMERADDEELKATYLAIQQLYEKFLEVALDPHSQINFYHGDLHRGNIFFDNKTKNLTLIDFGNAGTLSRDIRHAILEIYGYTGSTYAHEEKSLENAILELGKVMQEFVFKFNQERINKSKTTGSLIKTFFASCFNPILTPRERINGGRFLTGKAEELRALKTTIAARLEKKDRSVTAQDLEVTQDDIDFIKALQNNCFNGPVNPLLIALADQKMLVSDKLNTVFQELQKNGLAMPKEVIFFNKSKSLLEGILTNLDNMLQTKGAVYSFVDPDEIYKRVLAKVSEHPSSSNGKDATGASASAQASAKASSSENPDASDKSESSGKSDPSNNSSSSSSASVSNTLNGPKAKSGT
jgi:predicted unusual protein kinase regulating ubiquinone biosynthesis (AarF/ABC1/UbiB family)